MNDARAQISTLFLIGCSLLIACGETSLDAVHPELVAPDSLLYFGLVPVLGSRSAEVDLRNAGRAQLRVTEVKILQDEQVFTLLSAPSEVEGGDTQKISVSFVPRSETDYSAILVVQSDDPFLPLVEVVLKGRGFTRPPNSQSDMSYKRSRVNSQIKNDPAAHCLWWKENTTIEYRQNWLGNEATTDETEFDATRKAFKNWDGVLASCGSLRFSEGDVTPTRVVGHNPSSGNNENVVLYRTRLCASVVGSSDRCWRDESCGNKYDCWQFDKATIGLTTTTYEESSGQILGADVELNSVSFVFTTVDDPVCVSPVFNQSCVATDVENTMTHEIGHLLGLAHTPQPGSTMNASAPGGEISKRVVDPGSKDFICSVYAQGQQSLDCVYDFRQSFEEPAAKGCTTAGGLGVIGPGLVLMALSRRRSRM